MKKFPIKIILILGLIISISILTKQFLGLINFSQSEIALERGENLKAQQNQTLIQKFTANRDGLFQIQFLLKYCNLNKGDEIKMELFDESCSKKIREGLLIKTHFSHNEGVYNFRFKQIPDSNNKTYCIKATTLKNKENGKIVRFYTTENSYFKYTAENTTTGERTLTHLSMRPGYKNENLYQDFKEINQRISQYKPWFLKHHAITIFFLLMSLSSLGTVVLLIKNL